MGTPWTWMEGLVDVVFPPSCAACGAVLERREAFCGRCSLEVGLLPPGCERCAEPGDFPARLCPRCSRALPPFNRAWAPFSHEGAVAHAIHLFKYEDRPELAVPLAHLLAEGSAPFASWANAVCAIPLHRSRYRERKYDQAHLLASELSRATGLRPLPDALLRVRATKRQVGLDEASRELNLAGAFLGSASARGRRLLLVDDVFTTGATARAAARAALEAGALGVRILTLARAHAGSANGGPGL